MSSDLKDQVAIVTGGSRGLGREMVLAFAAAGADVVIASRKLPACQALAEAMGLRFDDVREGASARVTAHAAGDDAEARRRLDDDLRAGRLRGDDADILRVLTEHAERRCASTRPLMGPMADGLFSPIE